MSGLSEAVGVAKGVKTRRVVHFGEVGKFMADNVVAEMVWEEHESCRKSDNSLRTTRSESFAPESDFDFARFEIESVGKLQCAEGEICM